MALRFLALSELDAASEGQFGGKAYGLSALIRDRADVPPGFAVSATDRPPAQWDEADCAEFLSRCQALLAEGRVAVRSSAVGEDSADRSFAGMLETFLNLTDSHEALNAAGRCIASGQSDRIKAYAAGKALPVVGVVVQRQIEARAAGVCFTVDPSGQDRAIVVEAVPGLGDALVSGQAQPDRWRVYRTGLGSWEVRADGLRSVSAALRSEQVELIAVQGARLAETRGLPLDLEWAIDQAGALWWLQARPITVARAPIEYVIERLAAGIDDGPVVVWANFNIRETMPDPFPPLAWSVWRDVVLPIAIEQSAGVSRHSPRFPQFAPIDLVNGRMYFNINAVLGIPIMGSFFKRNLASIDVRTAQAVKELSATGVFHPRRLSGGLLPFLLGVAQAGTLSAIRTSKGLVPSWVLKSFERCSAAILARPDVGELSDPDLIGELKIFHNPVVAPIRNGLSVLTFPVAAFKAAESMFRKFPDARRLLTAGLPGPTTEISLGVDDLIFHARPLKAHFALPLSSAALLERLEADPAGAAWVQLFRAFLARFGQRGPKEFDFTSPRWNDDPAMILDLVRAGLEVPAPERLSERLARLTAQRKAAIETAVAASPLWRRPIMRILAWAVEIYSPLREAPKHHAMRIFERMRRAALELGARLVARGHLDQLEDVFFLEWREAEALLTGVGAAPDTRAIIPGRRALQHRFLTEKAPEILRSDGVPVKELEDAGSADPNVLRGTGVSSGVYTGTVRVLRAPDPKLMTSGDVIVMEFADPGWTPLFPRAGAVVMEVGGLMCHAAVVARELGVPAVFGIKGATTLLKDGQRVTVNGDEGKVVLEG